MFQPDLFDQSSPPASAPIVAPEPLPIAECDACGNHQRARDGIACEKCGDMFKWSAPVTPTVRPPDEHGLFGELPIPDDVEQVVQSIYVHFEDLAGMEAFSKLIGFPVSTKTRILPWPLDDLFPDRGPSALAAMKPEETPA